MLNTELLELSGIDSSLVDLNKSYFNISSNTNNIIIELFLKKDW